MLSVAANASTSTTINSVEYSVDTLGHVKVGPGTMHTKLLFKSSGKTFRAEVLTMEMAGHDNVEYRMEIGQDTTLSTENISSIAMRKSDANTHYFAGVNADFFITTSYVPQYAGEPHMDCIMNGEIASTGYLNAADYGHFFMDKNKYMWCDNPTQSFVITFPDGSEVVMPRINEDIHEGEMVLFNSKYGRQTRVTGCTDVQVRLAEGETWGVNKAIRLVVVSDPSTSGCTPINKAEAVLSALGSTYAEKIAQLKKGDELVANFSIALQDYGVAPDVKECSGGDVVILKRGEVILEAHRFINSRDGNNPRTMFGYDENRTKMVWCAIDGRQAGYSDGCTYPEGADVMKFLGCYDALNLDGGGSTGMYIEPFGIVNKPSDGKERAVANGMFAVLKAPEDNEIAEIRFKDWSMTFPKYGSYTPVVYGYNKYGLLIDTDVQGFTLECPEELGEIQNGGSSFFGNGSGTHALTAIYNGLTADLPVTIENTASAELKYSSVLIDNYRQWPVEVQALVKEEYMAIDPQAMNWSSSDESVASVDAFSGVVKGIKDGTAMITGTVGDFSGTVNVSVQCPAKQIMPIESDLDLATWKFTKSSMKSNEVTKVGNGVAFDFVISSSRGPSIKMSKDDLPIWSLPDAIRLRINPGDVTVSRITIGARANNGKIVNTKIEPKLDANKENVVELPIADFADVNDIGIYPVYLMAITIEPSGKNGTEYRIEIPGIEAVYKNVQSGIYDLEQDMKNDPGIVVAGNTVIVPCFSDIIEVYDISGQIVSRVENATTVSVPGKGLYIVSYKSDVKNAVGKVLILD